MIDIVVPALGESVTEAIVSDWKVAEGDTVRKDQLLVELETDKVAVDINAPADGVITKIAAPEGTEVQIGALLAVLGEGAGASAAAPASAKPARAEAPDKGAAAESGGKVIDVAIPQMGESVGEGVIAQWLVDVGAPVQKDAPLVEVETDKVAIEVPSPVDGVLVEQLVKQGDTVEVGSVIARVREGAAPAASSAESKPAAAAPGGSAPETKTMPSAARILAEKGIAAETLTGTGKGGRITKADALAAAPAPAATAPSAVPVRTGPREERVRMSRLRQTIARRLKEAQNTAAMLTTFNEADMSAIMESRRKYKDLFARKHGIKLGFMSFFVKACVTALKDVPEVNAQIDGTDIIYKNHYDIGIAVGTDRGLVVPVVRDCDQKSMGEIELAIAAYAKKAREGKLSLEDMQGATFTITNGGVYGSLMSTPILNLPQSGILGMHAIKERPIAMNGEVVIRPMMYLALSYDHRIVDGKGAVTFLVRVKECLEDPERLLFDL